jgi:glycosyltransferase involved in cell wall biosynthesis
MGKANPDRMNGVNKVVYQLATRQAQAGIDVQVWGFTKDLSVNYAERNFATTLFLAPKFVFDLGPNFLNALNTLNRSTTVFHLHGGWIPPFFKAAKALKKAEFKYVVTGHGAYNTIAMQRSQWKKRAYFQLCEKFLLKNAAAIHCIGASEVTGLKAFFPNDRTILIPYGMEFNGPTPEASEASEASKKFVFGFVGRLDYHTKGLDLMLEGFARHFSNDPSVVLWIIGDGEGRAEVITRMEELGITDNVVLWGSKFGEEKDALLQQMNVFLHPSRNEGLPSAVLEAAALSIPCIVTEATNVGEYISRYDAGLVLPNENAEKLGLAMAYCTQIRPSLLKQMGANGAQMVASQFNWSYIVQQFNQLYA